MGVFVGVGEGPAVGEGPGVIVFEGVLVGVPGVLVTVGVLVAVGIGVGVIVPHPTFCDPSEADCSHQSLPSSVSRLFNSRPKIEVLVGFAGLEPVQTVSGGVITLESPQRTKSMPVPILPVIAAAPPEWEGSHNISEPIYRSVAELIPVVS